MKLRLEGNSIRLRVRKSDLKTFEETGVIKEILMFPHGAPFHYQLLTDNYVDRIYAEVSSDGITVFIPLSIAHDWIRSDDVGIEHTLQSGMYILIEKDFPCKDRAEEDKNDTFFELVDGKIVNC